MKIFIFILFILASSISYSQDKEDFKNGIDFVATGNESDWSLKIDMDKEIRFSSANLNINTREPSVKDIILNQKDVTFVYIGGSSRTKSDGLEFNAKTKKYKIKVTALKEPVIKDEPEKNHSYSVTVKITSIKKKSKKTFTGFGKFTYDERLEKKWLTKKMNGEDFKQSKFGSKKSSITFDIKRNSAYGTAGCNNYSIEAEVRGSVIAFWGGNSTQIFCDNQDEEYKFLGAISGKDIHYKIENDKLFFLYKDNIVLEFQLDQSK